MQAIYATEVDAAVIARSVALEKKWQKELATGLIQMDINYKTALIHHRHQLRNNPGFGYLQLLLLPHLLTLMFHLRRLLVPGSDNGATVASFPPFSTTPGSEFYEMANDVYTKSQSLSAEQKNLALYFRDAD